MAFTEEQVTTDPQLASPVPNISRCCLSPTRVWVHHREEKAGVNTSMRAIVVCARCKGPADGSRPEAWAFPWHLLRREES